MVHIGPMVYSRDADGTLSLENAAWEGGCILPGTGSDRVLYRITDHLGSVRAVRDGQGPAAVRLLSLRKREQGVDGRDLDHAIRSPASLRWQGNCRR